jgi:hypothetical protein
MAKESSVMKITKSVLFAACSSLCIAGSASMGQTFDADRLIADLETLSRAGQGVRTVSFAGMPTGSLTAPGTIGVALSGSYGPLRGVPGSDTATRFDAATSLVMGFGDPVNALGFEAGIVNLSFRQFGHSGYLQFGVNRQFTLGQSTLSTAVRVTDVAGWGDAKKNKTGVSLVNTIGYGIETQNGTMPAMAVFGVGSNIRENKKAGAILGFGVGVSQDWSVSAGLYGDSGVLGASYCQSAFKTDPV